MNRSSEIREFPVSRRARITRQQAGLLASWAVTSQAEADSR